MNIIISFRLRKSLIFKQFRPYFPACLFVYNLHMTTNTANIQLGAWLNIRRRWQFRRSYSACKTRELIIAWYLEISILAAVMIGANHGFKFSYVPVVWFFVIYVVAQTFAIMDTGSVKPITIVK